MPVTTVGTIVNRAKLVLQEVTSSGTRWRNEELIDWLNESYAAICIVKPDAASINETVQLQSGTKQRIPESGTRLLDVVRNTASGSAGYGITVTSRRALDQTRRAWHRDPSSVDIEQFVFDDLDPKTFYVYPPASSGAEVEVIYSSVPTPHSGSLSSLENTPIKLDDTYAPVILDYILYRAHSKDADFAANLQRASMHLQSMNNALGAKIEVDLQGSPNSPDGSSNPGGNR